MFLPPEPGTRPPRARWSQWRCRSRPAMLHPLLLLAAILSSTLAKTPCEKKVEECESRGLKRPVCGSDDQTYPTRCHLLRAKCAGSRGLTVVWRGPCSERQPCLGHRQSEDTGIKGYRPKCRRDGTYAPVQCHKGTGYCWCVTPFGVPIPNTSVRNVKPKCHRGRFTKSRGNGNRKVCRNAEKVKFINNLVRKFHKDLCRHEEGIDNCRHDAESYKKGVERKFKMLDINSNMNLTSNEYHDFQQLVKKAVSPQKCSRSFISICDENSDTVITFDEWTACLVKRPSVKKPRNKPPPESDFRGVIGPPPALQDLLNGHIPPIDETEVAPERKDEPERSDCLTDRKSVGGEQPTVSFELFIPECTPDGRYQKVQCYKSTGYCWCVNEDSGKPIPGTSRKDLNPNCDALQLPLRPMKGCPEHKKKIFLTELKEYFKSQNRSGSEMKNPENHEEFALMTFQLIDTNKNKFIEKKEMKPLRARMATFSQQVKRCGKKFPKYCDVNHDRKISGTEWVNCMDSERSGVGMTVSPSPQRKGPNPLEIYLKPDDDD